MIRIFKGCQVQFEIATCWVATATVDILARNPELFLNVCRCSVDWWDDGASRWVRILSDMDRFCGKAFIFVFGVVPDPVICVSKRVLELTVNVTLR